MKNGIRRPIEIWTTGHVVDAHHVRVVDAHHVNVDAHVSVE